ncbi:CPCC family cysteine-rich protein [Olivibacter domesticus]|uniref:Cysteine-rich CPCC n=1 Tax=Olivibacter domesticus TaxID=407022 RepID=A0A1H7IKZ3_OLID1|nr:CPCC family cysteine-rich protein [Olivibacter domesticus]SEK62397.1 Cysteine-rich CPCC [Olivibacter domesticus]
MVTLTRKEALALLSFHYLIGLKEEEREHVLLDMISDYEENRRDTPEYNTYILSYYHEVNLGVRNEYLVEEIVKIIGVQVQIVGREEELNGCPCCGFKTLKTRGAYEICRLCHWEDDGNRGQDEYSSVNRSTLTSARKSFTNEQDKHEGDIRFRKFLVDK